MHIFFLHGNAAGILLQPVRSATTRFLSRHSADFGHSVDEGMRIGTSYLTIRNTILKLGNIISLATYMVPEYN